MIYITTPLEKSHKTDDFSCSEESLDRYLRQYASQDVKRWGATAFVHLDNDDVVLGYYTLSSLAVPKDNMPDKLRKKLSVYAEQPATLIGRLAVDSTQQGQGLGKDLLMDALRRSHQAALAVASAAVVVDALNENASKFYQKYGFVELPGTNRLVIGMRSVAKLFG